MHRLSFSAYCGMRTFSETFEDKADARREAARVLRERRRKYKCTTIEPGKEWEVLEPDDAIMVSDECGLLHISHITFECKDCGNGHETKQEAIDCCSPEYIEEEE